MSFEFETPEVDQEKVEKVLTKNGDRQVAPEGNYKVRLHNISGRVYTRKSDGAEGQQLAKLFFINTEGNFKGAELTLFRVGGNSATTTNAEAVMTIALAAGLDKDSLGEANWSIDISAKADDFGNLPAAIGTAKGGELNIVGLEMEAFIGVSERKDGTKYNEIKNLKVLS